MNFLGDGTILSIVLSVLTFVEENQARIARISAAANEYIFIYIYINIYNIYIYIYIYISGALLG